MGRQNASLATLQPQFIYISGGINLYDDILNNVERYDSIRDIWISLPGLN